jgi:starch-binding outer membrane protein, SusD/RagB family
MRFKRIIIIPFILLFFSGCKKYLDAKPDKQFVVPSSLQDLQALLDNYNKLNENDPNAVAEASSDNYYLKDADWSSLAENYRRIYTWEKDYLFTPYPNHWSTAYDRIYSVNVVLDNIVKLERTEDNKFDWDNIKGQALCFRAKAFLDIATIWALAYNRNSASTDLGIVLRLNSDFNAPSVRSTVKETYDQVIKDFKESIPLLPVMAKSIYRPSRAAAYALLSRTYLYMSQFDSAYAYANLCLQLKTDLMDFNGDLQINSSAAYPFTRLNKEIILESRSPSITPLDNSRAKIDSALVTSYDNNDLRKTLFLKNNNNGTFGFKGSYEGDGSIFTSVATDEVYLMRAECAARKGLTQAAMTDLNKLMVKRWKSTAPFPGYTASSSAEALEIILTERRKELIMRGTRWMDIKRFNVENGGISLRRKINNQTYILNANDPRFALPIPEEIIQRTGMPQNPR